MNNTFTFEGRAGALPGLPGLPILAWREGANLYALLPTEHSPGRVDQVYHRVVITDGIPIGDTAIALRQLYPQLQTQIHALSGVPRPDDHPGYVLEFWHWAHRHIAAQVGGRRKAEALSDPMPERGENWGSGTAG